jgi:hypothetical protein
LDEELEFLLEGERGVVDDGFPGMMVVVGVFGVEVTEVVLVFYFLLGELRGVLGEVL